MSKIETFSKKVNKTFYVKGFFLTISFVSLPKQKHPEKICRCAITFYPHTEKSNHFVLRSFMPSSLSPQEVFFICGGIDAKCKQFSQKINSVNKYSETSLQRTPLGPQNSVRYREVSATQKFFLNWLILFQKLTLESQVSCN